MRCHLSPNVLFFLAFTAILSCSSPAKVQKVETREYAISPGESTQVDSVMQMKIRPYRDSLDKQLNKELVRSDEAMEKGLPESTLGNFFSDVCFRATGELYRPADGRGVDFAFFNNGGLRSSLPRGIIRISDVYELMPFENELVILTLDGSTVQKIFNFIASKGGVPVAGLRMSIQNNKPVQVMVNNAVFDSTRVYKVVTSDYLANGGDQCFFLEDAVAREYAGKKIRDVLIDHLADMGRRNETVRGQLDRRIIVTDAK